MKKRSSDDDMQMCPRHCVVFRLNSPAHEARWEQVQKSIHSTGTYDLTETELVFGAKVAWRNAPRCIGRIQWSKLQVFDCRSVTTTAGMFEALCNHVKYATNKGNIRSSITIFPKRTDGKHDFRVWNSQLVSYAGYRNPDGTITGDPLQAEFTELCLKLGWKSKRTNFDVLPWVLSANGEDPDYFDIPPDLVLQVPLSHPKYQWFEDLGLKWYALPAVSSMLFDCGGLQFTACPFNGWYMGTEIGSRDLCDSHRYNITEKVALKMGLDTRTPVTLWRDRAVLEVNIAVLHSFQLHNVTIMDHHTLSDSFMKHLENEQKLRNGCPGDWVWIVPPMSSSLSPIFHQEMANYFLYPNFEYQDPAWRTHEWKCDNETGDDPKDRRKFHFKQVARAVKFTSKLFGTALEKRIVATILYATETGRSEMYARKLGELFSHAFHSKVMSMDNYDISSIEHEALLLVVVSTSGNGDPPENGQDFAKDIYSLKMDQVELSSGEPSPKSIGTSASFIKANSQSEPGVLERVDSIRGSVTDDVFGPLSNVRFAVFALGSSAYPNFCAFGSYVDNILTDLGGEQLMKIAMGDELCGQEQAFQKWAPQVYSLACETFCLDYNDTLAQATLSLKADALTTSNVRFIEDKEDSLLKAYEKGLNKNVFRCSLLGKRNLHGNESEKATLLCEISRDEALSYEPGDHIGILPKNRTEQVDSIIDHLDCSIDPDKPVRLEMLKERATPNGPIMEWTEHEKLPCVSLRGLLTRFLDITTPPSPTLLQFFAAYAQDSNDAAKLNRLATDNEAYEDWRHWSFPTIHEVLEQFPSVRPQAALFCAQLPTLQPRFYSVSSAPNLYSNQIHLTVAVVQYRINGGTGPMHYGVASNYLYELKIEEEIYLFVRRAPSFRLPTDDLKPVIMVGPGTGIAPFRGFWMHRMVERSLKGPDKFGKMILFFGCRTKDLDLYREEKESMLREGVLTKVFLALSREKNHPKTYVQDLLILESRNVFNALIYEKGHFYVCGDCTMAEGVFKTLRQIIKEEGRMTDQEVDNFMMTLRDEGRYHEDIFGITLRTAEVQSRSRESARIRLASQTQP